jgi:small-conductance mechanosensitive channel
METILNQLEGLSFLGNDIISWLLALAGATVLYLVLTLMFRILKTRTKSLSEKTDTVVDDILAFALKATRQWFLLIAAAWGGGLFLEQGSFQTKTDLVLLVAATLQIALWSNAVVSAYISYYTKSRREDDPGSVSAVQGLSFVVRLLIWSVAILLMIDNLGYDVTALVAGLGIGGVAIALAVQNILGDLFASLSIVLDKPFVVGDFVIVGELMGVVEKIGVKTTRVKSLSGEQLIFANSDLLNSRIRNFKRMQERRVPFTFGVLYQTTPERLEEIPPMIKGIIEGIENTRFDRAHFKGFGASSYDFEIVYYIGSPDYNIFMDVQEKINLGICRKFAEMGVEFAYPTRTIFMNEASSDTD